MRSYEDISESVLRRRDEYLVRQKKRRTAVRRSLTAALSLIIVVFICAGIWNSGSLRAAIRRS